MLPELLTCALLALAASSGPSGGVSGRVTVMKAGAALPDASNAVVWIDGLYVTGAPAGVVKAEMKSEHKSFLPRIIAVPKNAAVDFPNVDPIFHNVFSVSPGNRFDFARPRQRRKNDFRFLRDSASIVSPPMSGRMPLRSRSRIDDRSRRR